MRQKMCGRICDRVKKRIDGKWAYPAFLALAVLVVTGLSVPPGAVYGSTTDWFPQHVALAETIRTECLRQGTLLPEYLSLGGGSNGFMFSYYGFLRPDIVAGCLLPGVSMLYLVISYMLMEYLVSILLFYRLLLSDGKSRFVSFWGSMLFLFAGCFFHTHRQLMFVNYMPYLLAALLLVKKKRYGWVCVCLTLAYCNSFYYAPAVLAVLGWYWLREEGWSFLKHYVKAAALSIGMAAALLIPTGLVILEHKRGGAAGGVEELLEFQWDFTSLLYTPYGMGLTLVCLYALFLGLMAPRFRADSICYLCVCGFAVFPWILNATLYARNKILIPFVPLVVMHCVRVFEGMAEEKRYVRLLPFVPIAVVVLSYEGKKRFAQIAAEAAVLLAVTTFVMVQKKRLTRPYYLALLILPAAFCLQTAWTEQYVSGDEAMDPAVSQEKSRHWDVASVGQEMASLSSGEVLMDSPDTGGKAGEPQTDALSGGAETGEAGEFGPAEEAAKAAGLPAFWYRTESLYEPLDTANRYITASAGEEDTISQRGSMYSSVTNGAYAKVWYDLLQTPIRINNRVALLASDNPFLLQFMGIRYVQTAPDQVPDGYRITELGENIVIAENDRVLPRAYMVTDVMEEEAFERLDPYAKLDALMKTTIVEEGADETVSGLMVSGAKGGQEPVAGGAQEKTKPGAAVRNPEETESGTAGGMRVYEPGFAAWDMKGITMEEDGPGAWVITAGKDAEIKLELSHPVTDEILLLSFSVERKSADAVVIDINQIRNKLSGKGAAYPNENNEFHYQFSESDADGVSKLTVELSAGRYRISDVQWRCYAKENLYQKDVLPVKAQETKGNEILSCVSDTDQDTLFVTSIPRQRGMQILVDGKEVPLRTVNTAFAGAMIPAGRHEIRLIFYAPGLRAGLLISAVSVCLALVFILRESFAGQRNHERHVRPRFKRK